MQAANDMDLLREYAEQNSQQAFATIVSRHINLVYSVALRHAGNPHQAQDITQAVFIVLAKKAKSLGRGTVLSGWLFHAARMTAGNFLRTELRRSRREREAYMQSTLTDADTGHDWQQIAPLLDTAIAELGETDRNAVVLRYVEGKDLKEVGLALGASEEAAKKRVSRAVEKLRGFFSKRGVMLSGAALVGAISANAVQAAPAGLAVTVAATAMTGAATGASTLTLVKGTLKLMAWTKLKIAVGLGAAALMAYQWHQNAEQSKQLAGLQDQLQEARQSAQREQVEIDRLKQEKLAMVNEKAASEKAAVNLLAHQRTAFNKATAKNAAAAAAAGSNSAGSALSKIMDDPAMKDFMRMQQVNAIKTQYAPLLKQLNLSPEAADKFTQLLVDDGFRKMELGMAVMKGDVDSATAKQTMLDQQAETKNQLQSLLGTDGFAQYQSFAEEVPAHTMLTLLKGQLGDNPLTEDQSAKMLTLLKTSPKMDEVDPFGQNQDATDKYLQQQAARNQQIMQQAADFLSPEQLAGLGTYQTNLMNIMRVGASMKQRMASGK